MNVVENVTKGSSRKSSGTGLRTGAEYLESLRDGRQVEEPDNWLRDLIQFRDMRPKGATDSERRDGMPATRKRLGHTTEAQTADYVRDRVGELVDPGVVDRPAWLDDLKAAS